MDAPVYFNHGRWVANCPVPGCGDAVALHPQDRHTGVPSPHPVLMQLCANGHDLRLVAPPEELRARIETALMERVSATRRNWFPRDHPYALANGWKHGETVDEIKRETDVGESADAEAVAARRAVLLSQMKEFGVTVDEALAVLKGS